MSRCTHNASKFSSVLQKKKYEIITNNKDKANEIKNWVQRESSQRLLSNLVICDETEVVPFDTNTELQYIGQAAATPTVCHNKSNITLHKTIAWPAVLPLLRAC